MVESMLPEISVSSVALLQYSRLLYLSCRGRPEERKMRERYEDLVDD